MSIDVARGDAILCGEPRIDGTRIGVRHVAARVVEAGQTPAHVVDQLDSTLAGASAGLSDDDATRDGVQAIEAATDEVVERVEGRR